MTLKDNREIGLMKKTGALLLEIFSQLPNLMVPGVTTAEIDAYIEDQQKAKGMKSTTVGYHGYRHVSCISVNDVIVHGVPGAYVLKEGDLVKVDVCASYQGYCADMARCFFVGKAPSEQAQKLVEVAQQALDAGIQQMYPGNRLSNISAAIQQVVEQSGFGVVRDFAGHGIGQRMHEDPEILNYGRSNRGPVLRAGMVFALEPMITMGHYDCYVARDGWSALTRDGSLAAHVEDTVAVVENGFEILTRE